MEGHIGFPFTSFTLPVWIFFSWKKWPMVNFGTNLFVLSYMWLGSVYIKAILRWNYWTAFLVDVSEQKLDSSLTKVFCLVFYLHFSIPQNAIHEKIWAFLFRGFFVRILKIREESGDQCCGSGMFIPDPGSNIFSSRIPDPTFFHPGSRIRFFSIPAHGSTSKYFNAKNCF